MEDNVNLEKEVEAALNTLKGIHQNRTAAIISDKDHARIYAAKIVLDFAKGQW